MSAPWASTNKSGGGANNTSVDSMSSPLLDGRSHLLPPVATAAPPSPVHNRSGDGNQPLSPSSKRSTSAHFAAKKQAAPIPDGPSTHSSQRKGNGPAGGGGGGLLPQDSSSFGPMYSSSGDLRKPNVPPQYPPASGERGYEPPSLSRVSSGHSSYNTSPSLGPKKQPPQLPENSTNPINNNNNNNNSASLFFDDAAKAGAGANPKGSKPPLASTKLEAKLAQIQESIDDFYDDRDLMLVAKSQDNTRTRALPGLAGHIRRIPIAGPGERAPEAKLKAKVEKKPQDSFYALGRILQSKANDRVVFKFDSGIAAVSMLGIILMLINSILAWIPRTAIPPDPTLAPAVPVPTFANGTAMGTQVPITLAPPAISLRDRPLSEQLKPEVAATIIILNYVILVSSIGAIGLVCVYYKYLLDMKKAEWCQLNGLPIMPRNVAYSFVASSLPWYLLAEIAIHIIFPYPWFNVLTNANARYLELFMLTRCYTLLRLLHHRAPLYRMRHDIVRGNQELKSANFQVRFTDTMKVYFYENTLIAGAMMYAFVALVGGFAVFVAERETNNGLDPVPKFPANAPLGFNTWFDGVYFMVVSVRTIGYGDLRPVTLVGRILTVVFQFVGMSVEALLGSVAINKIAKSKEEKIIDEYLQSFHAWHELRVAAAMLIQASWKSSLRYQYLHHRRGDDDGHVSVEKKKEREKQKKDMERVLRMQRRRREFFHRVVVGGNTFTMPEYSDITNQAKALNINSVRVRMEPDRSLSAVALKQIRISYASASSDKHSSGANAVAGMVSSDHRGNDLFEKMPYLRKKDQNVDSAELVRTHKKLFTQDMDVVRWGKNSSQQLPPGFKPFRTFTATKKVVGRQGERRVPIGIGHKANIQLQALKAYGAARKNFKATLASSSDHVVETKLLMCYDLLANASEKLKRNSLLLKGLKRVSSIELEAVEQLLRLSMSGGMDIPTSTSLSGGGGGGGGPIL